MDMRIIKHKTGFLLAAADAMSIALALFFAYFLRSYANPWISLSPIQTIGKYLTALPLATGFLLLIFYFLGLYDRKTTADNFKESYLLLKGVTFWMLLIMTGAYLYKYDYARTVTLMFGFFALLLLLVERGMFKYFSKKLAILKTQNQKVAIVGKNEQATIIAKQISSLKNTGLEFAGFFDHHEIFAAIPKYGLHKIYIADKTLSHEKILNMIANCPYEHINFCVATDLFEFALGKNLNLYDIDEIPSLNLQRLKPNPVYLAAKRLFDLVFSSIGLVLTLPLWPLIAATIKYDSSGKAIITQDRVGLKGKKFKMYKFRTMRSDVDFYAPAPRSENDQRITKIGWFLRKTSLDELPQLWNVLKGEMSIVGPRPEMPFIVEKYKPWQKKRLEVKPGLTGLWQILGRKDLPLDENLHYDFYYINNQSLLLDLTIILKTIPYVILGKGAY